MFEIKRLTASTPSTAKELTVLMKQLSDKVVTDQLLSECLKSPHTAILVVMDKDKIIGTATLTFSQTLSGLSAYIDHVIVDENYRGRGLGAQLMEKAIDLAREKKVRKIKLTSRPSRVAAHGLYKKLGFEQKETDVFELKL